jgi:RNA polymerase sigma factor (sigma-70 family)
MSTALLARPAAADRAFERLYKRHVHEVYRYVLAVLRNQADAEDVTQATFLNAYRAVTRGEEPLKPRNWLLKIAHNECRQRFRAASRRPKEVEWDERTPAPSAEEAVPTVDEIRTALAVLSFNQRSALVMRELEGRSYVEIAKILDLSVSAVETLLFRARRALREQLEGALTCGEAEATLSKRLDARLTMSEQRALRAHLRQCRECSVLERRQRARRAAVKRLGAVQLPPSLAGFLGGSGGSVTGGAILGSGIVAKTAAVLAVGMVAGSVGHEAVQAVAADKPRTPLPQLRQIAPQFRPLGGISAPGTLALDEATATGGAASSQPIRVRRGVRTALDRGSAGGTTAEATTAPAPEGAPAPKQAHPVLGSPPQSPAAPQPVQDVVDSATQVTTQVTNQVPTPPVSVPQNITAPPPPLQLPPVTVPTVPTVPPVPPLPPPPPIP